MAVAGTVTRVVHRNGPFAIFCLKPETGDPEVTALGDVLVDEGDDLAIEGTWQTSPRWGPQIRVQSYRPTPPATEKGIERFLSSRVSGVGPELAARIVRRFGVKTPEVLDQSPARLREVEGIGPVRWRAIARAWAEKTAHRETLIFLQGHGIGPSLSTRILDRYGSEAVARIREDPYQLARDVPQVGFKTADQLARSIGLPPDSPARARAGLAHVLEEASDEGHVGLPVEMAVEMARGLLDQPDEVVRPALEAAVAGGDIDREAIDGVSIAFLPHLRRAEEEAASLLAEIARAARKFPAFDPIRAAAWYEERARVRLSEGQRKAIEGLSAATLVVITGGPGVGKTTVVRAFVEIARARRVRVALGAPTGRAAKRLATATGCDARTIHRLLEYAPPQGFRRNTENPLDAGLVVIDEASMLDVPLVRYLLRAVRPGTTLVLVGDTDQLPSVGPGRVLQDVIDSGLARVVRLCEIFRQGEGSGIVRAAHEILDGRLPDLRAPADGDPPRDFYFIPREEPEAARDAILTVVTDRIPLRFGFDPLDDVQVLAPMRRGVAGVEALNDALRARLLPAAGGAAAAPEGGAGVIAGRFLPGDKVMQVENDYDRDVFNGDIGRVVGRAGENVAIRFDGRDVLYDVAALQGVDLAYAISVHKSQGSEYPAVVIPVLTQHYVMLRRNLIYTAITRGARLVVLVGQRRAIEIAVRNDADERRHAFLRERIRRRLAGMGAP